jgi:hypothetical protein
MTREEYQEIRNKLSEVAGSLSAMSFMVSLPRHADEERKRHERHLLAQEAKLEVLRERIREIEKRDFADESVGF